MIVDFQRLQNEVSDCRALLLQLQSRLDVQPVKKEQDEGTPLSIAEASTFLGVSKQTIYQNIARIPHKKRFGRLYFYRSELAEYLNTGKGIGA